MWDLGLGIHNLGGGLQGTEKPIEITNSIGGHVYRGGLGFTVRGFFDLGFWIQDTLNPKPWFKQLSPKPLGLMV